METETKTQSQPTAHNDPRICLSLPVYHRADVPFVQCLINLLLKTEIIGQVDFLPGDSLVNRARNNLTGRFLEGFSATDDKGQPVTILHDWLLFIDTDLIFNPDSVIQLYEAAKKRGPGIYCGTYPIKQLKPKIVFNNLPGHVPDAEGWVRVREAGTGFMLIHREVFEKMREQYRDEIEFIADTGTTEIKKGWDFFTVGVRMDNDLQRKRFLSEDWYFCQRWRAMGGEIWMQTRVQCGHIGNYTYPGDPKAVMEAAEHYKKAFELAAKPAVHSVKVKTVRSEPEATGAAAVPVAATD